MIHETDLYELNVLHYIAEVMTSAKTRVIATLDGEVRELFSVRETGDRSLIVIIRAEVRGAPGSEFGTQAWETYRVSIHPSSNSVRPGSTIKATMATDKGRKLENAQFINGPRGDLMAVAFAKLCPVLDERYKPNIKSNDRIIYTQNFSNSDRATLIYIVIVTASEQPAPDGLKGFTLHFVDFTNFRLNIYTTLSNLPPSHVGGWHQPCTSSPRIDGEFTSMNRFEDAVSISSSQIHSLLVEISENLSASTLRIFLNEYPEFEVLMDMPLWFHENAEVAKISRIARGGV